MKNISNPELTKNEYIDVFCDGMTLEGMGIVKQFDRPLFVKHLIKGEKARVKIIKKTSKFYVGRIDELLESSDTRAEPFCRSYGICGGCALEHLSKKGRHDLLLHELQRTMKYYKIDAPLEAVVSCEMTRYRQKIIVPVRKTKDKKCVVGYFKERTHDVIPFSECKLVREPLEKIVNEVQTYLEEIDCEGYDELREEGFLKNIFLRESRSTQEIMIGFVVRNEDHIKIEQLKKCIEQLAQRFRITSGMLLIQPKPTNTVVSGEARCLYGKTYITEQLDGYSFDVGLNAFMQVNIPVTEEIYRTLKAALPNHLRKGTLIDLYSGVGTIGLVMSDAFEHVLGVEIVEEAVQNAIENAKRNKKSHMTYICGDAKDITFEKNETYTIIVDPPRKGCDEQLLDTIKDSGAEGVLYVSCNPQTLMRDLSYLSGAYRVDKIIPFDMFPHTKHVETVALLQRVKF